MDTEKVTLARAIIELKKIIEEQGGSDIQLETEDELWEIIDRDA